MTFKQAMKTCFWNKYATFSGRASRSEYGYFWLVMFLPTMFAGLGFAIFERRVIVSDDDFYVIVFAFLFLLATTLPTIATNCRRLHDLNRSGWWQVLGLIPIVGLLFMLIWLLLFILPGTKGDNHYGEPPA